MGKYDTHYTETLLMLTTPPARPHGRLLLLLGAALALLACGSDTLSGPPDPLQLPMEWTFGGGLDGWTLHNRTAGDGGGQASHDASNGRVVLSGSGAPGEPDAWMSREVTLPEIDIGELWIDVHGITDCLAAKGNDSQARLTVRAPDGSTTVVDDWHKVVPLDSPVLIVGGSIHQFAGQTVTITIEQDDEGEQEGDTPESVCVSRIEILAD